MLLFRLAKVLISIYISNNFNDFYSFRCVIDVEIVFETFNVLYFRSITLGFNQTYFDPKYNKSIPTSTPTKSITFNFIFLS